MGQGTTQPPYLTLNQTRHVSVFNTKDTVVEDTVPMAFPWLCQACLGRPSLSSWLHFVRRAREEPRRRMLMSCAQADAVVSGVDQDSNLPLSDSKSCVPTACPSGTNDWGGSWVFQGCANSVSRSKRQSTQKHFELSANSVPGTWEDRHLYSLHV